MLSHASKLLFGLAGFAFLLFAGYGVAVGDRSGTLVLFGMCLAALATGLIVTAATINEPIPVTVDAGAPSERIAVDPTAVGRPSPWPLVAALAFGLAAVGAAVNGKLIIVAVIFSLVPVGGWLGQVWRENAGWTPDLDARLNDRVLVPVALPVGMFLLVLAIGVSISRVLLALPEKGSTVGALVVALLVLGGLGTIAARLPRLRSSALIAVAVVGAVAVLTAGTVGAATGERKFEHKAISPFPTFKLVASNTSYNLKQIVVPAGAHQLEVNFVNKDAIFHNFAIYTTDGKPVFNGKPLFSNKISYAVTTPAPGTYQFLCDFHPTIMKGEFVVK